MHEPTLEDSNVIRQYNEMIAHSKRNRLQRFYHTAGLLTCLQLVVALGCDVWIFASSIEKHGVASDVTLLLVALFIIPATIGFLIRKFLVAHVRAAQRVLNACAFAMIAAIIMVPRPNQPAQGSIPPSVIDLMWLAIYAYSSLHISAMFWLLSDRGVCRQRK